MPSVRSAPSAVTVSALLLGLVLSGCAKAEAPADPEPPIGQVPVLLESRDLEYPIAAYLPTLGQRGSLAAAQDVLIDQCARRWGFRYEFRRKVNPRAKWDNGRRYGISDPVLAGRLGYENPGDTGQAKPPPAPVGPNEKLVLYGKEVDPSVRTPESQEEAETSDVATVVVGGKKVPAGGCLRESALKLHSPKKTTIADMDVQAFDGDAYARARQDSRVVGVIKEWSACMKEAGHEMANPLDRPPGVEDAAAGGPRAIAIAKRDIACKRRTNLVGIWYTVEVAYQKRLIDQNAELLDQAKRELEERLRYASTLVAQGA
ncbi:hypothetical protein ACN20G_06200 [Streptomyces sp. BI20]|uniref:hypothetical protein n=1 Tax=Streptomyces sp. BI20 TaxID=3403460 RepID=UPI003C779931